MIPTIRGFGDRAPQSARTLYRATNEIPRGLSALCEAFQRPIDGLSVAEMVALGESAAELRARAGFVFAVNAARDQLDVERPRRFDKSL